MQKQFRKQMKVTLLLSLSTISYTGWSSIHPPNINTPITNKSIIAELPVTLKFSGKPLSQVLNTIQERSGISFDIPPHFINRTVKINQTFADWKTATQALLKDYNQVSIINVKGQLKRVIITGLAGSGKDNKLTSLSSSSLFTYSGNTLSAQQVNSKPPKELSHLPANSVFPIRFDLSALTSLSFGDIITLNLPSGQFQILYDNLITHENGDITWVGYIDGLGTDYRVVVTLGNNGSIGRIVTPEGIFKVETDGQNDWLIDINSSGTTAVALTNDGLNGSDLVNLSKNTQQTSVVNGMSGFEHNGSMIHYDLDHSASADSNSTKANEIAFGVPANAESSSTTSSNSNNSSSSGDTSSNLTQIDVMMLYTPAMQTNSALQTRLNQLISLSNQAYIDSDVQIKIRLVHSELINYNDSDNNSTALTALTNNQGAFANIATLREQHGADLVSLIRPFNLTGHVSCGVAWVGGANGGNFNKQLAYSVVSDGRDGQYYCTDYTFAHELGHNMGSTHDRANSNFEGKYGYSYGHGIGDKFGTIMSYINPEVGVFSNPDLDCGSSPRLPCGINENDTNSANNALSLNNTRKSIADFVATVYDNPDNNPDPESPPEPEPEPEIQPDPDNNPGFSVSQQGNDFDGDGNNDVIWRKGSKKINLWQMNGAQVKANVDIDPLSEKGFVVIAVGDFNGDESPDLLWRNRRSGRNIVSFMKGNKTLFTTEMPSASRYWRLVQTADLNADNKSDLIWQNRYSKKYVLWLLNGNRLLSATEITRDSIYWSIQEVADFNQDGNADIIWQNKRTHNLIIAMMNGAKEESTIALPSLGRLWRLNNVADFNGDNSQDIMLRHRLTGEIAILLLEGPYVTQAAIIARISDRGWRIRGSADFNNDGNADIMLQHRKGAVGTLLLNGFNILEIKNNPNRKHWVPFIN